ncbi:MAG: AraC family transcriptional regulator [Muribaculaceae bacterium]|nr:AraC family transcriptional regulator [Muribaculaceae bacterium]
MERSITISQLAALETISTQYCRLENEYLLAHLVGGVETERPRSRVPMRVDGLMFFLCRRGSMSIEVNLEKYKLNDNSLIGIGPDRIVSLDQVSAGQFDGYLFFLSRQFLEDTNIDLNILNVQPHLNVDENPTMELDAGEAELTESLFKLVYTNTISNDPVYVRSISRVLVAALYYQIMQMRARRQKTVDDNGKPRSRQLLYAHEFRQLVSKYHHRERSVSFYASRMFISPKYLSMVIKKTTGRSAAEWIDDYVILEAKNLLRFSGLNIQQIAYRLNFPNQSAFGKYFKHLTGMSPTAYQRS